MDQNSKKCVNGSIDINQVLTADSNEKKKVARRRWAILAKALKSPTGSEPSSPTDEFSVRRISSFMLLKSQKIDCVPSNLKDTLSLDQIKKCAWYKYSMFVDENEFSVTIGQRKRTFSAEDLMGFNNTGNICIWPSEETLSYYIGANLNLFKDKLVIELGGGMSCLAGLFCAKYAFPKHVTLTDGNRVSVENVQVSILCNEFVCPVVCEVLKWGGQQFKAESGGKFDVILCADCLFFDEARSDLIDTLWGLLSEKGLALVMAPKRGLTLQNFIFQSRQKGFRCKEIVNYNCVVWQKHLQLLENDEYDDNIHYPILIELTKL